MIPSHRRNLVLIGMMGSGKTTIGRHVARRLGRPFVDTDRIIGNEAGMSIPELFEAHGEEGFRALESAVIERVAAVPNQIIAVGGGAVCRTANVEALRATGDLVLLDAPVSQLAGRVARGAARGSRPLLRGDAATLTPAQSRRAGPTDTETPNPECRDEVLARLHHLWTERRAMYEAAAVHRVDAGHRPPAVIADEIVTWMNRQLTGSGDA